MNKTRRMLATCIFALSTAVTAYAQSPSPVVNSAIVPLEGGGVQHVKSGLQCPAALASFKYTGSRIASEATGDIVCEYNNESRRQQLSYFIITPIEGLAPKDLALRFARNMISEDEALDLDAEASRECQLGVGTAMLKLGTVQGDALAPQCVVLTRPERTKLVSIWDRDAVNIIALMSGPDTRLTNAVTAVFALSHQDSGQSPAQPKPTPPKRQGFSKEDLDKFCAEKRTQPTKGMQFNGKPVSPRVSAMRPGRYAYPDNGALLYFPDRSYIVRLPDTRKGIFGTDGDDVAMAGGIVAGCFVEQLSEIFQLNELDIDRFESEGYFAE